MIRHIAVVLSLGLAAPAAAQVAEAPADTGANYEAARNQLGILKYCNQEGFTGPEAVATQTRLIGMIEAGDEQAGAMAEQKGTEGTVAVGDAEISLAQAAESRESSVEATCQEIEAAVNEVAPGLPAG
nr:pore-forming ESAT-6 family protein [Paracoccus saliphilus]